MNDFYHDASVTAPFRANESQEEEFVEAIGQSDAWLEAELKRAIRQILPNMPGYSPLSAEFKLTEPCVNLTVRCL